MCIESVLAKGNFDQMKVEVENLARLSRVYVSTKDTRSYSRLFNENVRHLSSKAFSLPASTLGKLVSSIIFFFVGFLSIMRQLKEVDVIVSHGTTVVQGAIASFLF